MIGRLSLVQNIIFEWLIIEINYVRRLIYEANHLAAEDRIIKTRNYYYWIPISFDMTRERGFFLGT